MKLLSKMLAFAASALLAFTAFAQSKTNIFIATGPTTGVYYPMGGGMADILTKHVPGLNATAGTTDGSMANLLLIIAGLALVYPKAMFDYIGVALIVVVVTMQKLRKDGVHAAA